MSSVTLHVRLARRLPDPLSNSQHGTERHIFFVPVSAVPSGISTDPSPRSTRRWDVYKDVQASLLNRNCTPGTFHLKNRGITIVARRVEKIEENEYVLDFGPGQGIIDGANTYAVIRDAIKDMPKEIPKQQFVRLEVITKLPEEWVGEVAGALSTSIQAQSDSMRHLVDALGWLREELQDRHYFKAISWSEEQRGDIDIKEILCILTCFNTASYPNNGANHPIVASDNKSIVLSSFEQDYKADGGAAYKRLRPIVRDVLMLHDVVQSEFPTFHRQVGAAADGLIDSSGGNAFRFLFLGTSGTERLARGPLFAILAAFRWFVEDDPASGTVRWRGGFETVLRRWRELAPKFAQITQDRLVEAGGRADTVGRSASHWGMLHREVALSELMAGGTPGAAAGATAA